MLDKIKNNLALSLTSVNLILLVLIFFINDPFQIFASTYTKAKPFFPIAKESITKIGIHKKNSKEDSFKLFLEKDTWYIDIKSKKILADKTPVESLVKSVLAAKKFTIVSSSTDKLKDYGFDDESFEIEIFQGDKSAGILQIGSATPRGSNTHVKFGDDKNIYLVEDNLKNSAGRGKFDSFANKRLSLDEAKIEDVQEITLDSLNIANNYTIKKEGEDWKMSSPQEKTMKKEEVTSAVSAISNLSADEIIMEDTYKEKLEKDSNSTIKFIIKDKKGVPIPVSIFVEGKNKETNSYYVKKDSIDTVYKLNEHKLKPVLELNIPKEKEKEKKK